MHFFQGMNIVRKLDERKMILPPQQDKGSILEWFRLQNCHTVSTPLEPGAQLVINPRTSDTEEETFYRSILGSILYLMLGTRRDLAFTVGKLSEFGSNPSPTHMKALKRLL